MEDSQTINLNQNAAQCVHSISNWGETVYQNICNGASTTVQWGSMDYALTVFLCVLAGTVILLFVLLLVAVITEM